MQLVNQPLPPYSYVPGRFPHPTRDPRGHACEVPLSESPREWFDDSAYLRGIDLFNHGYYWEAHEAWEMVWIRCGREGIAADFTKALIKLAAALVKGREGRVIGVGRHGRRAVELLERVADFQSVDTMWGLSLAELRDFAQQLCKDSARWINRSDQPVVRVTDFELVPVFPQQGTKDARA